MANMANEHEPTVESAASPEDAGRSTATKAPVKHAGGNSIDMLHGPLPGKIILFAIPLALSSVLQQLFNSIGAVFAGRFIGNTALAAVGGVAPVIALLIGLFVGLSIGTNATVAMCIGRGDDEGVRRAVRTTTFVTVVSSVALTVFGIAITDPVLDLIDMPADSRAEAATYLRLYFAGISFFLIYNFGSAILRGKGDARRPLYALAAGALLSVGLDYIAVEILDAGVAGIAIATIIANALAAAIVVACLLREEEPFRLHPTDLRIGRHELRTILYIGIPSGLQSVVFSVSNVIIQVAINGFGTAAIAGSSAAWNYEYYTYFTVAAFGQAAVTFVGQNFAARKLDRCDTIVKFCLVTSLASGAVLSAIFVGLGDISIGAFTTEATALGFATTRMWHVELLEAAPGFYEVTAGAMRGMGWSVLPTVVVIIGSCLLRVVYIYTLFPLIASYENLMNIYPVTWFVTAAAMIVLYLIARKRSYAKVRAQLAGKATGGNAGAGAA